MIIELMYGINLCFYLTNTVNINAKNTFYVVNFIDERNCSAFMLLS